LEKVRQLKQKGFKTLELKKSGRDAIIKRKKHQRQPWDNEKGQLGMLEKKNDLLGLWC